MVGLTTAKLSSKLGKIQIALRAITRVTLDPVTIGGKLSVCWMDSGIVTLTCVGVGVKLTAASKASSSNYLEDKLKVMRSRHYGVAVAY